MFHQPTSERYDSQPSFANKKHKSVTDNISSSRPTPCVQMYGAVNQTVDAIDVRDNDDEDGQRMSNIAAEGDTFATLDDETRTDDTRKSYQASLN